MATKTTGYFVSRQQTTNCVAQRRGHAARRADREVEPLRFAVKTHQTFVELSVTFEHVSLTHLSLSERIDDRKRHSVFSVTHRVRALLAIALDLISIWTSAQRQFRIIVQHERAGDGFHRHRHPTLSMRCELFFMTLTARLIAGKNSVGWNSSRVPTLHRGHLAANFARLKDHNCERRKTECNHHRDKRILFPPFLH